MNNSIMLNNSPISNRTTKTMKLQKQINFILIAQLLIGVFAFLPKSDCLFVSSFLSPNTNASVLHKTCPQITSIVSSPNILNMSLRAWTCHGRTQRDMVEKLTSAGIIKTAPIKQALLRVDRGNYVLNPVAAYMDAPQPIGYDQTISAPHMHSHALEDILPTLTKMSRQLQQSPQIQKSDKDDESKSEQLNEAAELKILDVGCGSGYLSAVFGRLVDRGPRGPIHPLNQGRVFGIDVIPELVTLSRENILKADADLLESGTVTIAQGDGWKGLPNEGPFHAIHVGAAAESFPTDLMMQLHIGGVMVVPVGGTHDIQTLYKIERLRDNKDYRKEDFDMQKLLGVRYVPLVQSKRP